MLSTPLDDVEDNVALIRRQIADRRRDRPGRRADRRLPRRQLRTRAACARLERAAERVAARRLQRPDPDRPDGRGRPARARPSTRCSGGCAARLRPPRVHRQRLARAAHADRLARRLRRAARRRASPTRRRARGVRAHDARPGRPADEALHGPARPLAARRRGDRPADRARVDPVGRWPSEVAGEFAAAAEQHGTDDRVAIGRRRRKPLVQADRARTTQIMRILHRQRAEAHAARNTRSPSAASERRPAARRRLSVTDDGPGIEPRSRERVFERFYTADSVSGSGLGLAIAPRAGAR